MYFALVVIIRMLRECDVVAVLKELREIIAMKQSKDLLNNITISVEDKSNIILMIRFIRIAEEKKETKKKETKQKENKKKKKKDNNVVSVALMIVIVRKFLENLLIHFDFTVRNELMEIVQFRFGFDGVDPSKLHNNKILSHQISNNKVIKYCSFTFQIFNIKIKIHFYL